MFGASFEREAVARALYRRASSDTQPLDHVGDLAGVAMSASEIRAEPRFVELGARVNRRPELVRIPVLTPADLATLKPVVVVRTPEEFRRRVLLAVTIFLLAFWLAHAVRRWRGIDGDPLILPIVLVLSGIGLMSMIALRDPLRDTVIAFNFAVGVAAGAMVLVALSHVDFEASSLRRAVAPPLLMALGLAALLLLFGGGPGSSGAKVNLFGVQPVEAIRLLVVFALAAYFTQHLEFFREFSEPPTPSRPWLRYVQIPRLKDIGPVVISMSLVLLFFFLQKDLGPALVLSFVFLSLYAMARGRFALVMVGVGMLLSAFFVAYRLGFPATVRQRVAIWIDPWNSGVPGADQIAHGFWALATGAAWGTGSGLGDPQLIPAGHTDFVLAAIGEQLGFAGLFLVIALYGLLCWRCLRVAIRAPGDYTALLVTGVTLGLIVQAFVIAGGVLGLMPLSGVVTPFLSYGRSSMLANFAALGIVLGVARRAGRPRMHLSAPLWTIARVMAVAAGAVVCRAAWVQVVQADAILAAPTLAEQGDGGFRFQYNPRLIAAARSIQRGTIYDRNQLVLATSRAPEIREVAQAYRAAGVPLAGSCAVDEPRCYPLSASAFHVVGNVTYQTNWAARNSSFLERDHDAELKGFDERAATVEVRNRRTGGLERTLKRDYSAIVPLLRHRYQPSDSTVQALLTRNRDIHSSIDARLQARAASALRNGIESGHFTRGAAVVLDVDSGDVLASVSYPWPHDDDLRQRDAPASGSEIAERLLDRPRYGLYPPGSTFKLVVAAAALRENLANQTDSFACVRLPGGRVGSYLPGSARPVRDDPMDTTPHGVVDLHRGLVVSCNAYFAQLALRIGPQALLDAASLFQIDVCQRPSAAGLRPTLAHAGYGQGQVVVSPLKMVRVAAAIARQGRVQQIHWTAGTSSATANDTRLLSPASAALLSRYMREVVTAGTGRVLAGNRTPIAGKTGTAEVDGARAHSWFAGFAPYGGEAQRRIAFAVVIENAGYGARAAAPIAGELVTAARDLGLIR